MVLLLSFYLLPISTFVLYLLEGDVNLLEFYQPITYWFWFGFAFTFQLLSWVIVYDTFKAFSHWKFREKTSSINQGYGWTVVITACSMIVFTGNKMVRDTNAINTEYVSVPVPDLPESIEGLRIVHISDIQGDEYTGAKQISRYVNAINELQPDLVIFTGDLVSYGTDFIEMSAREFGKVQATHGTYAVVGDHDYWAGLSHVEPALEKHKIPLLRDENQIINVRGERILLTGITEVYSKRAEPEAVAKLASDTAKVTLRLMASHQVSDLLVTRAQQNNYALLMAGHTHGGQVRVPFFGKTYSASDLETPFISGQYKEGDLFINVNEGLGFTLAPVRYNVPPSITFIELTNEQG